MNCFILIVCISILIRIMVLNEMSAKHHAQPQTPITTVSREPTQPTKRAPRYYSEAQEAAKEKTRGTR